MNRPGRSPRLRWLTFALGVVLVGGALAAIIAQGGTLAQAAGHVRRASPALLALLIALPAVSLLCTSLSLQLLTLRFGRVGTGEMLALVSSAWLLNNLPMRPGMVGRIAYHKKVNGIEVKHSVRVLVEATVLTAVAAVCVFTAGLALATPYPAVRWGLGGALGVGLLAAGGFGLHRGRGGRLVVAAGAVRIADMLVWALRYWVVLDVLDSRVSVAQSVVLASVSQVAMAVPLTGNGLELREWAVGITAGSAKLADLQVVLVADLLNRGAELLVATPAGLVGIVLVSRWLAARKRAKAAERPTGPPPAEPA